MRYIFFISNYQNFFPIFSNLFCLRAVHSLIKGFNYLGLPPVPCLRLHLPSQLIHHYLLSTQAPALSTARAPTSLSSPPRSVRAPGEAASQTPLTTRSPWASFPWRNALWGSTKCTSPLWRPLAFVGPGMTINRTSTSSSILGQQVSLWFFEFFLHIKCLIGFCFTLIDLLSFLRWCCFPGWWGGEAGVCDEWDGDHLPWCIWRCRWEKLELWTGREDRLGTSRLILKYLFSHKVLFF